MNSNNSSTNKSYDNNIVKVPTVERKTSTGMLSEVLLFYKGLDGSHAFLLVMLLIFVGLMITWITVSLIDGLKAVVISLITIVYDLLTGFSGGSHKIVFSFSLSLYELITGFFGGIKHTINSLFDRVFSLLSGFGGGIYNVIYFILWSVFLLLACLMTFCWKNPEQAVQLVKAVPYNNNQMRIKSD